MKYLPKVSEDCKVKYFIKVGCLEEAAEVAFQQRDLQGLLYVQNKCGNQFPSLLEKINNMVSQLESRR
nr:unnamed protein product [Callosobruchus analis]